MGYGLRLGGNRYGHPKSIAERKAELIARRDEWRQKEAAEVQKTMDDPSLSDEEKRLELSYHSALMKESEQGFQAEADALAEEQRQAEAELTADYTARMQEHEARCEAVMNDDSLTNSQKLQELRNEKGLCMEETEEYNRQMAELRGEDGTETADGQDETAAQENGNEEMTGESAEQDETAQEDNGEASAEEAGEDDAETETEAETEENAYDSGADSAEASEESSNSGEASEESSNSAGDSAYDGEGSDSSDGYDGGAEYDGAGY